MNTSTISPKTAARYEQVSRQLRARYTRETGLEPGANCAAFQAWLRDLYATLSSANRRQYHAALTCDKRTPVAQRAVLTY